jgi:glycosyltransferase 2 family protein
VRARTAAVWAVALLSTAVFGWLAVRGTHPDEIWAALREADIWWLLPALAVLSLAVVVRAIRWRSLFPPETRPPLGPVTAAMLVGIAVNSVIPFRAGEAARILALGRRTGTSRMETLATVAIERVLDVFCLLVLLFVALPVLPDVTWVGGAAILAAVLAAILAGAAIAFAVWGDRPLHFLARLFGRLPVVDEDQIEHAGHSLMRGFVGLRQPGIAFAGFAWTIVGWVITSVSFWIVTLAFHLDLPLSAGLLILAAVGLSLVLPAAPGALGVFEAAVVLALAAYDVPRTDALSYAFALHAVNFFPYLVAGAIALRFTRSSR